jgi:serine/threonine protein kinase
VPLEAANVGCVGYMAPEVAVPLVDRPRPKDAYRFPVRFEVGLAADMWSLGAIAYEIMTGMKLMPLDEETEAPAKHVYHPLSHQIWELKLLVSSGPIELALCITRFFLCIL